MQAWVYFIPALSNILVRRFDMVKDYCHHHFSESCLRTEKIWKDNKWRHERIWGFGGLVLWVFCDSCSDLLGFLWVRKDPSMWLVSKSFLFFSKVKKDWTNRLPHLHIVWYNLSKLIKNSCDFLTFCNHYQLNLHFPSETHQMCGIASSFSEIFKSEIAIFHL